MRWRTASPFVVLLACVGTLPHPTYVEQPTSALMEVGYPPPPARVEFIPKQPARNAVWVDGEWQWQGRRWSWRLGRWVVPPTDAEFAPWMMVRGSEGTVYYATGTWRNHRHEEVPEPAAVAMGRPSISDVPDPEGELEKTGPSIRGSDTRPDSGNAQDAGSEDEAAADAAYQDR